MRDRTRVRVRSLARRRRLAGVPAGRPAGARDGGAAAPPLAAAGHGAVDIGVRRPRSMRAMRRASRRCIWPMRPLLPPNAARARGPRSHPEVLGRLARGLHASSSRSPPTRSRAGATWRMPAGHYTLDGDPQGEGRSPLHDEGKFLEILRRQPDGTWRYAVDMYSSNLPAAQVTRVPSAGRAVIFRVPQVRRAPAREPRQDLAGSSAKRCPVSLRGA